MVCFVNNIFLATPKLEEKKTINISVLCVCETENPGWQINRLIWQNTFFYLGIKWWLNKHFFWKINYFCEWQTIFLVSNQFYECERIWFIIFMWYRRNASIYHQWIYFFFKKVILQWKKFLSTKIGTLIWKWIAVYTRTNIENYIGIRIENCIGIRIGIWIQFCIKNCLRACFEVYTKIFQSRKPQFELKNYNLSWKTTTRSKNHNLRSNITICARIEPSNLRSHFKSHRSSHGIKSNFMCSNPKFASFSSSTYYISTLTQPKQFIGE